MDTTGTPYSMAKFGGFLDKNGDFEVSISGLHVRCHFYLRRRHPWHLSLHHVHCRSRPHGHHFRHHRLLPLNQSVLRPHFCESATLGHGTRADPHRVVDDGERQKYQLGICRRFRAGFPNRALIPLTYPIGKDHFNRYLFSHWKENLLIIDINGSALFIEKKASFGHITHDKIKRELWWTGLAGVGIVPICIKISLSRLRPRYTSTKRRTGQTSRLAVLSKWKMQKGVKELPVAVRITE
ncbi:hypothetical protein BC936DRAFT_145510 [Jimgerdemannia flammicorona]|uniref:Uncharacterized protein n=1 Tax=Jimgerdemannia flammicorona TaxID=994334 RepID=A0A433D9V9_9FUNG|nr:hypothetical protein BC936DRAFT_145510 [Jimgerdemannia flammicorona]